MEICDSRLKVCKGCQGSFPLTEFHMDRYTADGLKTRCRACANAIRRTSYARNPERARQAKRNWYHDNHERARKNGRDQQRRRRLRKFGLTGDDFDALVTAQANRCAICGVQDPPRWAIDHDHVSGHVRGLLCMNCNAGIGLLQDKPEVLEAAAVYIRASKS